MDNSFNINKKEFLNAVELYILDLRKKEWCTRIKECVNSVTRRTIEQYISIQTDFEPFWRENKYIINMARLVISAEIDTPYRGIKKLVLKKLPLAKFRKEPLYKVDIIDSSSGKSLIITSRRENSLIASYYIGISFILNMTENGIYKSIDTAFGVFNSFNALIQCYCHCYPQEIIKRFKTYKRRKSTKILEFINSDLESYFSYNEKQDLLNKTKKIESDLVHIQEFSEQILSEQSFITRKYGFHPIIFFPHLLIRDFIKIGLWKRKGIIESINEYISQCKEYQAWLKILFENLRKSPGIIDVLIDIDLFVRSYNLLIEIPEAKQQCLYKLSYQKPYEGIDPIAEKSMILRKKEHEEFFLTEKVLLHKTNGRHTMRHEEFETSIPTCTIGEINKSRLKIITKFHQVFELCAKIKEGFVKTINQCILRWFCIPFRFEIDFWGMAQSYHFEFDTNDAETKLFSAGLLYLDGTKGAEGEDDFEIDSVNKCFGYMWFEDVFITLYTTRSQVFNREGELLNLRDYKLCIFIRPAIIPLSIFLGFIMVEFLAFQLTFNSSLGVSSLIFALLSASIAIIIRYQPGPIADNILRCWKRVIIVGFLTYLIHCIVCSLASFYPDNVFAVITSFCVSIGSLVLFIVYYLYTLFLHHELYAIKCLWRKLLKYLIFSNEYV